MFKRNYFRVFDNLLMQEKLVYPTLGKEELNLSIGPMALTVAEVTTTSLLLFIIFFPKFIIIIGPMAEEVCNTPLLSFLSLYISDDGWNKQFVVKNFQRMLN